MSDQQPGQQRLKDLVKHPEKVAEFKTKARTLDTPSLRVLWGMMRDIPETSLALMLWVGGEVSRREQAGHDGTFTVGRDSRHPRGIRLTETGD